MARKQSVQDRKYVVLHMGIMLHATAEQSVQSESSIR